MNNQIQAEKVRVISSKGENLGIMDLEKAILLAKSQEMDLIEISAKSNPPITKIIKFDKFRYELAKKQKQNKISKKQSDTKVIRITAKSAINDLKVRLKQTEKFLNENHQIEITMVLKGREKTNKEWAQQKLDEFLQMITIPYKIINGPKISGRGIIIQIIKK
ncbi:MAG: translation initiation factor IF-3 [Minisyncoccia bacterium]